MTDLKVPQPPDDQPAWKRADELKPGDHVHADDLDPDLGGIVEVLFFSPAVDSVRVSVLIAQDGDEPLLLRVPQGRPINLATPTEIADARLDARRWQTAAQLRQLADLIVSHALPLPRYALDINFAGVTAVDAVELARVLGSEVTSRYSGLNEVVWPRGHQSYEDGVHATWHVERADTGLNFSREAEATDAGPVPAGVDGQAVGRAAGSARCRCGLTAFAAPELHEANCLAEQRHQTT